MSDGMLILIVMSIIWGGGAIATGWLCWDISRFAKEEMAKVDRP